MLITVAGTGQLGFAGDGGPGRRALLRHPEGLALKPRATEVPKVWPWRHVARSISLTS